jgi:hypothetical protein
MKKAWIVISTSLCCGVFSPTNDRASKPLVGPENSAMKGADSGMRGVPTTWRREVDGEDLELGRSEVGASEREKHNIDSALVESCATRAKVLCWEVAKWSAITAGVWGTGPLLGSIFYDLGCVGTAGAIGIGAGVDSVTTSIASYAMYQGLLGRYVLDKLAVIISKRLVEQGRVLRANAAELAECSRGGYKKFVQLHKECNEISEDQLPKDGSEQYPRCVAKCPRVWRLMRNIDPSVLIDGRLSTKEQAEFAACSMEYMKRAASKERDSGSSDRHIQELEEHLAKTLKQCLLSKSREQLSCVAKSVCVVTGLVAGSAAGAWLTYTTLSKRTEESGEVDSAAELHRATIWSALSTVAGIAGFGAQIGIVHEFRKFLRNMRHAALTKAVEQVLSDDTWLNNMLKGGGTTDSELRKSVALYEEDEGLRAQIIRRALETADEMLEQEEKEAEVRRVARVERAGAGIQAAAVATGNAAAYVGTKAIEGGQEIKKRVEEATERQDGVELSGLRKSRRMDDAAPHEPANPRKSVTTSSDAELAG